MPELIVAAVILLLVVITIGAGVRLVPQGEEWVVERLGRYRATLLPGLNLIIPYVDRVAYRLPTKDLILDVPQQAVITSDNAVILANAIAFIKVTDPKQASYGVENYAQAVISLATTSLRSIIGEMELDKALSSREQIKAQLIDAMANSTGDWGITVRSVELQDIQPSESMQLAMEQQAAAERLRKAAVTKASGEKEAMVLDAQGRLEAAKLDAHAQVALARASAEAIRSVKEALGEDSNAMMYLLGERYIKTLENLGDSNNSKLVVLPADLPAAIRGFMKS
ncbi:SPFH domain-containing protein [Pseudomonas matsuisoli]|uniref:Membrane protein n=1 Tax=Pseudomonas matsuisoli TaxID=1515666 RepID=A0A917PYY3_9PSED|nr:SPFH domain-containing protein [Pseudomonas matsuisoli]GGK00615.1 membrane protein [Pseudomonas matsuisoli]